MLASLVCFGLVLDKVHNTVVNKCKVSRICKLRQDLRVSKSIGLEGSKI